MFKFVHMRCKALYALFIVPLFAGQVMSQGIFDKQLPKHKYDASVVDSVYGIIMYEDLVMALGGDSVRKNGVYACNGWVEDAYLDGTILHKWFYQSGQLQSYKNYYPNGKIERDFSSVDALFAECKIYYASGQLKSQVKYQDGVAKQWTDYYPTGTLQFEEKMNRTMDYYEYQKYYYTSGKPSKVIEMVDKKKLSFNFFEYYESGAVKVQGHRIFVKESNTYFDHGDWVYFDESGAKIKTEKFDRGVKL
jgi:antitoxin component YwqK of YwqJK toxin-antitoxin module